MTTTPCEDRPPTTIQYILHGIPNSIADIGPCPEWKRWRRQIMKRLNERPELTQKAIADVFDMSAGRTNEIINE